MTQLTDQVKEAKLTVLGDVLGCTEPAPKKPKKGKVEPAVIDAELQISKEDTRPMLVPKQSEALMLMPVMDLATAKARLAEFQAFVKDYMKIDEDFGKIPGIEKPSLFQPGADKLNELYGLAPTFPDERTKAVIDWSMDPPLFDYEVTCVLLSKRTGAVVAEGKGSCSSYESKYRWRDAKRKCPKCEKEAIIKGNEKYGGGWVCWAKRDGCGAKWPDGTKEIESQTVGRVANEDMADVKNTVLKIATKRAKIAATLAATRSSGIFTQDVEDTHGNGNGSEPAKLEGFVIQGALDQLTPLRGELWMKCGEKTCVVRGDGKKKFEGLHGETVELLVTPKQAAKGNKEFFEIKELQRVITLEEIPF